MKTIKHFIIFISMLLLLYGCNNNKSKHAKPVEDSQNIYKEQISINYSQSFSVEYNGVYKIVRVYSPGDKTNVIYQYLLIPKNQALPNIDGDFQIIRTPIESAITLSSIYVGMFDRLGLTDKIKAVDKFDHVSSPKVRELINHGKIKEVGSTDNFNMELLIDINPGIVFTYGKGDPHLDGHTKLIQSGINIGSATEHLENTPLARAEWIKFIALFFDKEKEANKIFNEVVTEYTKLQKLTQDIKDKPAVFTQAMYSGIWYTAGGNSYSAKLLQDAGANYLWSDDSSTGSLALTFEQVYDKAYNADFWLNIHNWQKISDVPKDDSRYVNFKAYKEKNVFNYNALLNEFGGNRYWETGLINPHIVLADLIKIFHPSLLPEHDLVYYQRLKPE